MPTLAERQYYCATTTAQTGRKAVRTRKKTLRVTLSTQKIKITLDKQKKPYYKHNYGARIMCL